MDWYNVAYLNKPIKWNHSLPVKTSGDTNNKKSSIKY